MWARFLSWGVCTHLLLRGPRIPLSVCSDLCKANSLSNPRGRRKDRELGERRKWVCEGSAVAMRGPRS